MSTHFKKSDSELEVHRASRAQRHRFLDARPEQWQTKRLKYVSHTRVSNVDKKSEDENVVRLCNYIDVYKNEFIEDSIEFMPATATDRQIDEFQIKHGDVIFTKDSETPDDIGVPAFVKMKDTDGIVCGYHLALITPDTEVLDGLYLFRLIESQPYRSHFEVSCNGVTRFGLNTYAILNTEVLLPPLPYQRAIAGFLDRKTALIDNVIAKKQKLIELLKEKRQALITQAVTKGLDPNARLKPSGIEWLGDIPEGWEVKRLKHVTKCLDGRRVPLNSEQRGEMQGDYPYWGANGIVDHVNDWLFDEELVLLGEDGAPFFEQNRDVAFRVTGRIWVNNHAHILKPTCINPQFLTHVLNTVDYRAFIDGSTRDKLTQSDMGTIPVQVPPENTQYQIVEFLDRKNTRIDEAIEKINGQITRLREYRQALITSAVTGKIDVRGE